METTKLSVSCPLFRIQEDTFRYNARSFIIHVNTEEMRQFTHYKIDGLRNELWCINKKYSKCKLLINGCHSLNDGNAFETPLMPIITERIWYSTSDVTVCFQETPISKIKDLS